VPEGKKSGTCMGKGKRETTSAPTGSHWGKTFGLFTGEGPERRESSKYTATKKLKKKGERCSM